MRFLLTLLLTLLITAAHGQTERRWEPALAGVMTAEDTESTVWEDTYDMLCELEQHPFDLNTVSREELEALPFLTAQQVEDLMEYRYRYGTLKSVNELRMIRSLDARLVELLRYFVYVAEEPVSDKGFSLADAARYGHNELMGNVRVPFYSRRGDDNGYAGYPYRHWLRYQFSFKDYVRIGIVGSQDAGEPFFSNKNSTGYDFYSYYLQVRHWGCAENIVVGRYKLSFGMGLVVNNGFGMGKLATLQQLGRSTNTVRPHSSRSQSDFMQGAAATLLLSPRCQLTTFLSYRPFDATLNSDGTIRTIVTDGYHRTPTELEKKNNSHAVDAGAHIAYRHNGLYVGASALYTHTDRELRPDTRTLYRRYSAQGSDFLNVSADYGYLKSRFTLSGETAVNRDGAVATINSVSLRATDELNIMLLHRFFSYRYTALYARTMAEGGHAQNEQGAYVGLTWQPTPRLSLRAYTDYSYFPWARYQVSQASHAWDNLLTAVYNFHDWTFTARYRLHLRQRDNETKTMLADLTEQRGRLSAAWLGRVFSSGTQIDLTSAGSGDKGYMVSQILGWRLQPLRLTVQGGYFNTDSYDSRLYVYERGPLYSFSFPSFYGEGMRCALMLQSTFSSRLSLTAKLGYTHYFDHSTIGSGLQQIDKPSQTDLDMQVRWKF